MQDRKEVTILASSAVLVGIGIAIGIAIGIGIGFGVFTNSNLEKQIEEQNAKIATLESELKLANEKIDSLQKSQPDIQAMMQMMMQNPAMMKQMIDVMMKNPEFMQAIMKAMGNSQMMESMSSMMGSMTGQMMFNPNAPITIPMIDGYYNGKKVFFIHTEVSDKGMADMMTGMVNFPTLHVPALKNISEENFGKVYVFTNGIRGSGPYGGGPFMFQIDIFDSIPQQEGYSQFRVPHLVTWNADTSQRVLTSEEDLLNSEANGELTIKKTDNVVNAPVIVWQEDSKQHVASSIERIFESMPNFEAEVINVDLDNYIVTVRLHSIS